MQLHHLGKSLFGKAALATAALSGLLFLAGAPGAQAADRDDNRRSDNRPAFSEGRGYFNRPADRWDRERHEVFERQYVPVYRNGWDRDRDDHRYYYRDDDRRDHRDRDRDRDR
jgi:hypothetical protein